MASQIARVPPPTAKPQISPLLIDQQAAAELLGVPLRRIKALVTANAIPHVWLGRQCLRFSPAVLARWIETRHDLDKLAPIPAETETDQEDDDTQE